MNSKSIFIVDDESIIVIELSEFLKNQGFKISGRAFSPTKAKNLATQVNFDLLLIDLNIKGKHTGIALSRELCIDHQVPVIFITGSSEKEIKELMNQESFDFPVDYMIKPIIKPVLVKKINSFLS